MVVWLTMLPVPGCGHSCPGNTDSAPGELFVLPLLYKTFGRWATRTLQNVQAAYQFGSKNICAPKDQLQPSIFSCGDIQERRQALQPWRCLVRALAITD